MASTRARKMSPNNWKMYRHTIFGAKKDILKRLSCLTSQGTHLRLSSRVVESHWECLVHEQAFDGVQSPDRHQCRNIVTASLEGKTCQYKAHAHFSLSSLSISLLQQSWVRILETLVGSPGWPKVFWTVPLHGGILLYACSIWFGEAMRDPPQK